MRLNDYGPGREPLPASYQATAGATQADAARLRTVGRLFAVLTLVLAGAFAGQSALGADPTQPTSSPNVQTGHTGGSVSTLPFYRTGAERPVSAPSVRTRYGVRSGAIAGSRAVLRRQRATCGYRAYRRYVRRAERRGLFYVAGWAECRSRG